MTSEQFLEGLNLDVSGHVEKKGNFSYLSWPFAVARLRERYPDARLYSAIFNWSVGDKASPNVNHNEGCWACGGDPRPYAIHDEGCWVMVHLEIDGKTHPYWFPVLDHKNNPVRPDNVTSFDINTSIQRAKVKVIAEVTGIGLYIYAGEDLPGGLAGSGSKFADDELKTALLDALNHPAMHLPLNPNVKETRREKLLDKHDGLGWLTNEVKSDLTKVKAFCEKYDAEAIERPVGVA